MHLLLVGSISREMRDVARDFPAQFTIARFDAVRCIPLMRLSGGGGPGDLTDTAVCARLRVGSTLKALGDVSSPAGSSVWYVVGRSAKPGVGDAKGWGVRPVNEEYAQGILIAALGVLAGHYGYV